MLSSRSGNGNAVSPGAETKPRKSHLDSQASYTDLVNSSDNAQPRLRDASPSNLGPEDSIAQSGGGNIAPVTATVISNMRGRSILSGSREMLVAVNG